MSQSAPVFDRILLKLSGEALKRAGGSTALTVDALDMLGRQVAEVVGRGVQLGIVVGGGNFFRGLRSGRSSGISRVTGDYIGMLATVMNSLALRDTLEKCGVKTRVMTSFEMPGISEIFDHRRAIDMLESGEVVIFGGGTGHPFFTTDTTAALRACEIRADAILKATKVDGVYSGDPVKNVEAVRYRRLSFGDALRQRLEIMDSTAFSLCQDNGIPIIVFNFQHPGALAGVIGGDTDCATFVGDFETLAYDDQGKAQVERSRPSRLKLQQTDFV